MPHKKRSHGHHKQHKEEKEQGKQSQPEHHEPRPSVFYTAAVSCHGQSQPSQATPKPAAQASAATPAQFEKSGSGSRMAAKPLAVGTSTAGGATAGRGGGSVLTAGKVTPKATAEASSVSQVRAPAEAPPPAAAAAAAAAAAGTTASSAVNVPKDAAKSAAAVPQQASASKIDPAKAAKPSAAAGKVSVQGKTDAPKPTQTKVQVEVPAAASRGTSQAPALDPFDALADSLPSAAPVAPQPAYTGAEVKELSVTAEKGQKCGERDATLPPGYRFEDMPRVPADVKPKDTPKPLSTDEALDSLSAGFMTSTSPAKPEKKDNVGSVTASSAAPANFAPPPAKKPESPAVVPPVAVCPAPPAMKKASAGFSLQAGLSPSASKEAGAVCPPADKKAKLEEAAGKPSTAGRSAVPTDALSALGSLLPTSAPKPELPEVRPKDIVTEDKHKKEKGVLVGEDENTIPPEYRLSKEELMKLPAPKPEPTLDTVEALDILSGDLLSSSTAPVAQAPVVTPSNSQIKVEDLSAVDVLSGDLMSSTKAAKVQAPLPPAAKKTPEKAVCPPPQPLHAGLVPGESRQGGSMSLDALNALGGMLPTDAPKPELPELRPEDIVSEEKQKKEKGVLVGEDENTIPPEYRFNEEDLRKLPAPKPEPPIDTGGALDFLSGDLMTSSTAAAVQAPVVSASAPPPAQSSADAALDALAGEFVSSSSAPAVKSACGPAQTTPSPAGGADSAMDALSATLMDIAPTPHPEPVFPTKDVVKEKTIVEERLIKMGERDDTLPPEHQPTEEDLKKMAEFKEQAATKPKEKTLDDKTALDFLSSGFETKPASIPTDAATAKLEPPVPDSNPLKPMAGPVLESLADSLVPAAMEAKTQTDKAKGKSKSKSRSKKPQPEEPPTAVLQSASLRSDVVPTTQAGKR
ncbi:calpastatin isoform X23 [Nelusetta ayraudi]|uniref:calpastatin isoform X23 n=1 Tax=Nelusetta ayraudi TaxID=303726 RepID=UPI003F708DF0